MENLYFFSKPRPLYNSTNAPRIIFSAHCIFFLFIYSPPSFLGLFTRSSHSIDVTAAIVRVGVVAGMSILSLIFGFPFFDFARVTEFTKLRPFFSNVSMTSSVCESVGLAQYSLWLSASWRQNDDVCEELRSVWCILCFCYHKYSNRWS